MPVITTESLVVPVLVFTPVMVAVAVALMAMSSRIMAVADMMLVTGDVPVYFVVVSTRMLGLPGRGQGRGNLMLVHHIRALTGCQPLRRL